MTAFTDILNGQIDQDSPVTQPLMTAYRDNLLASLEGDLTAPVDQNNWHPYNKVLNGDANNGRIWSLAVDGAVAVLTTPDFVDGFDYLFLFDRINASTGTNNILRVNFFKETGGAYSGLQNLSTIDNGAGGVPMTGYLQFDSPRLVRPSHIICGVVLSSAISDGVFPVSASLSGGGVRHLTPQKVLRVQFSFTTGNIAGTNAAIYMLKKRTTSV